MWPAGPHRPRQSSGRLTTPIVIIPCLLLAIVCCRQTVDAVIATGPGRTAIGDDDDQERIEGSARGGASWTSDDEDFDDGSGSGQAPYQPPHFEPDNTDVDIPHANDDSKTPEAVIPVDEPEMPTMGSSPALSSSVSTGLLCTVIFGLLRFQ